MEKLNITIKGFKCFADSTFELDKMTLLTGANASGKSSVVQALLLLKDASESDGTLSLLSLDDPRYAFDFGSADSLINNELKGDEVTIALSDDIVMGFSGGEQEQSRKLLVGVDGLDGLKAAFDKGLTYFTAERQGPRYEYDRKAAGAEGCGCRGENTGNVISDNWNSRVAGTKLLHEKEVDEVVIAVYKGPKSFTGEDLVEIICHGSILIANEILELLISNGARYATNGEYSSRAFLNQKIDLIQAEAINDVINATTKEAKDLSILSLQGKTSSLVVPLKTRLADLLSLIEVNIDYPEYEDIEVANKETIIKAVDELVPQIEKLVKEGEQGKIIKEGVKVAIIGKPNVGKSSLLNALLGESKAIVTDIAGTTRDIVEGEINLNGIVLHLLDTAGIRDAEDKIESIGVVKSKEMIEKADLVIVVLDASSDLDELDKEILKMSEDKTRIVAYNKSDLSTDKLDGDKIYISAQNNDISSLKKEIFKVLGVDMNAVSNPSLNNTRQLGLLRNAKEALQKAKTDADNDLSMDLVSVSLYDAYTSILEILGEANQMDISKEIFSRFCVGK